MSKLRRRLARGVASGPVALLAAVLLATVFLAAAAPRLIETFETRALQRTLTGAPALNRTMSATGGWVVSPGNGPRVDQLRQSLRAMGPHLPPPLASPAASRWADVATPFLPVLNAAPSATAASDQPLLEIVYREPLSRHLRVVSGRLPDRYSTSGAGRQATVTLDAAVNQATAARFSLHLGSDIQLGRVVLHVVGITRPADPATAFWSYDQTFFGPKLEGAFTEHPYWEAAALIGPGELPALQAGYSGSQLSLVLDLPLDLRFVTAAEASGLQGTLANLASSPLTVAASQGYPSGMTVAGNMTSVLGQFLTEVSAVAEVMSLIVTGLFLISLVLILLAARLVVERRDSELATLRARGASLPGIAIRILATTTPLLLIALAAGAAAAVALVPSPDTVTSWQLAGTLGIVALLGPGLLAAASQRGTGHAPGSRRADVTIPRRSRRRLVAEVSAAALTAGAVLALRTRQAGQGSGVNVLAGAGPLLVALLAALVVISCYPLPLRLVLRMTRRRRGAVVHLGLARAARSASTALLPALVLILAMAMAGFGGMVNTTVSSTRVANSWDQVGADASVSVNDIHRMTAAQVTSLSRVPGARHTVAVSDEAGSVAVGSRTASTTAVSASVSRYAALSGDTPWGSFAPSPLADRGSRIIPVLVSPDLAGLTSRTGVLTTPDDVPLRIRAVGVLTATPAVPSGSFVVVPAWAASRNEGPWPTNLMLLTGRPIDGAALRRAVARAVPFGAVRLRAEVLRTSLATIPMETVANQSVALCVGFAAVLAVAAVLAGLALAAGSRERLLVTLAAMGMRPGQSRVVAMMENIPLFVVALAGGVLAAIALPVAIGPALDLAVFTGSSAPVAVRPGLVPLLATAAGAAVLITATAVGHGAATRRNEIGRQLRTGEN